MLSQLTRCVKNLLSRLSYAANQLLRRMTEPARPNLVSGTFADLTCSRAELLAENALLRQQLIVLRRRTKTPRLTWQERLTLLFLARWVPNWKQILQIIKPDTLLRWHREGFRLFWKLKSRVPVQTQPQHLAPETIPLTQRMARDNPYQGITQRIPAPRASPPGEPNAGKVMAFPVLNGLHHDCRRPAIQAGVGQKNGRMKGVANTASRLRSLSVWLPAIAG